MADETTQATAQRYGGTIARDRMANGECPECGEAASEHLDDARFWLPRRCSLRPDGVTERIAQYERDLAGGGS